MQAPDGLETGPSPTAICRTAAEDIQASEDMSLAPLLKFREV